MEDLGRDDRLISRWILQKCCGLDSSGSRWAQLQILVNREPPAPSQFYKRREISLLLNKMLAVSRSVFVCLNMFPLRAMKACKGSRYNMQRPAFLTSAVDGDGWSTSRPYCFTLRKEHRYRLNRRLGGTKKRSGRSRKKDNFLLLLGFLIIQRLCKSDFLKSKLDCTDT